MPPYAWLLRQRYDPADIQASLRALRRAGVPYTAEEIARAHQSVADQAGEIVSRLQQAGIAAEPDREIIAMIAYLQRLGKDGRAAIEAGRTGSGEATATAVTP